MSHYFSRVRLARAGLDRNELARIAAEDAYLEHALVWRLFPGNGLERDFVFRTDRDESGWPAFLVVSSREPIGVPGLLTVESKKYAPLLAEGDRIQFRLRVNPTVATATALSDEALAAYNAKRTAAGMPAKARREQRKFHDVLMAAKKRNGHPLPEGASAEQHAELSQAMDDAAKGWLESHAEYWGLQICRREDPLSDELKPVLDWSGYRQHRLRHRGKQVEFSSLDYQGMAEVSNQEKLIQALTQGVGRAKAFGCGLLLIRLADSS